MPETPPDVAAIVGEVTQAAVNLTPMGQMGLMRATATGSNPCIARGLFTEQLAFVGPAIADINNAGARAAGFLHLAVRESIQRQGRVAAGVSGGKSLARFMIDSGPRVAGGTGLIPTIPRGLLIGWLAEALWLERGHLPTGSELASGAWRNKMSASAAVRANGEKLAPGIYLYPKASILDPERSGSKLRGPGVRSLIEQWLDYQAANVYPTEVPAARAQLINAYGKWTGGGPYGLFAEGDPPKPGSRAYNANALLAQLLELVDLSTARCDEYEGLTVEVGRTRLGIEKTQSEVLAEEARARTLRSNVIVFAGLAIGVFVAVRRV